MILNILFLPINFIVKKYEYLASNVWLSFCSLDLSSSRKEKALKIISEGDASILSSVYDLSSDKDFIIKAIKTGNMGKNFFFIDKSLREDHEIIFHFFCYKYDYVDGDILVMMDDPEFYYKIIKIFGLGTINKHEFWKDKFIEMKRDNRFNTDKSWWLNFERNQMLENKFSNGLLSESYQKQNSDICFGFNA
jgi:hypothetical protein